MKRINVVVLNVSLKEGMAGTMRVNNLVEPLIVNEKITSSNLVFTQSHEKNKISNVGITKSGIPYKYIGYNSPFNIKNVYFFYKEAIIFLRKNFRYGSKNIIYNYGYPDIKNLLILHIAKKMGYKIIFDIVEDNKTILKHSGILGWIRMKSSQQLLKKIPVLAVGVFVISKHLHVQLKIICKNKVPVYHIPIAVNLNRFPIKKWEIDSYNMKIFYGGSFFLKKDGIQFLIRAFKKLTVKYQGLHLYLSGMPTFKEDMDEIIDLIDNCSQIEYMGYLSSEAYFNIINECDIFCMPRIDSKMANSGFPFKLGEFLATGKAVIATKVGDVPIYLNEKNAVLIEPESESAIQNAIEFCINNTQEIRQMGIQARKTADIYFNSDLLSKKILSIFNDI